jgi:hypothetical protein
MESTTASWESFYVIVGSSAGALTGLQFVVMALVADVQQRASFETINAFATPNIVHFCAVLLFSAVLSAPWQSLSSVAWLLAIVSIPGIAYVAIVHRRASSQDGYQPVLEDWIFHVILPFVSYALVFTAAILLPRHPVTAMDIIAAMSLLLLFVGIHNAWDTVTFVVVERSKREERKGKLPL